MVPRLALGMLEMRQLTFIGDPQTHTPWKKKTIVRLLMLYLFAPDFSNRPSSPSDDR
jgi:hypothetical protein